MKSEFQLSRAFVSRHPQAAARVLERLGPEVVADYLSELELHPAVTVLSAMVTAHGAAYLAAMPADAAAALLDACDRDTAATLLRAMPPDAAQARLERVPQSTQRRLTRLMRYPDGSVGSRMRSYLFVLPATISVTEALKRIRQTHQLSQHHIYVNDEALRLKGVLSLVQLLRADAQAPIAQLALRSVPGIPVRASVKEVVDMPVWRHHQYLPVIDSKTRLVGEIDFSSLHDAVPIQVTADTGAATTTFLEWLWLSLAVALTATLDTLFDTQRAKRDTHDNGV
ncbi:hypothetical protein Tel_09795 [Candidatus Tenderia electrophaga]|jgi:magnesium transporter|uniref:CBS domain-containing protein n=1 Tax=Candidatus Tenderia electrophaga TaxID=1748243 RepID=A0A0S2TE52_9GAMM|nr:hypothetical protein Tel_09795 [Candidatus Tenderia electrophaga]